MTKKAKPQVKQPHTLTMIEKEDGVRQFEENEREVTKWIAASLIEIHKMQISVNGRYHHIPDDNTPLVPCFHCNTELPKASEAVGRLGRLWVLNGDKPLNMIMNNASNPLGRFRGFPIIAMKEECPNCHVKSICVGQLLY